MNYNHPPTDNQHESLRIEAVTTCVGFDDILDISLKYNHAHLDNLIVVTSHDDRKTQSVCRKYGATCVQTDLFKKNGRNFNKGAAINAGFGYFQYNGWRMHIDSDIVFPDNFRRILFNHTSLDTSCLYGADRMNVFGKKELERIFHHPQHEQGVFLSSHANNPIVPRYMDQLRGYIPIGFFQLWNAKTQKPYPYSLGTAAHDDVLFGDLWPSTHRRHLATILLYHICSHIPKVGENWDGKRRQPRID